MGLGRRGVTHTVVVWVSCLGKCLKAKLKLSFVAGLFPQFSVASQVETYLRPEVSPMQSISLAVNAAQAEAAQGACDNLSVAPFLSLVSVIASCSSCPFQLLL